jgi:hypothetical protein
MSTLTKKYSDVKVFLDYFHLITCLLRGRGWATPAPTGKGNHPDINFNNAHIILAEYFNIFGEIFSGISTILISKI